MSQLQDDLVLGKSVPCSSELYSEKDGMQEDYQRVYTKGEQIIAAVTAVFAFFFVMTAVFNPSGYLTSTVFIGAVTALIVFMKKSGIHFHVPAVLAASALYLFSLVYAVTANNFIKSLNTMFLFIAGSYFVYTSFRNDKKISRYLPLEILRSSLVYPFSNLFAQFGAMHYGIKNTKCGPSARRVIIGLMLAVPLTFIVAGLLMSADSGVERILSSAAEVIFSENIWTVVSEIILAVPVGCWVFGLIYTAKQSAHSESESADDEYEQSLERLRRINNLILYTAVTPVCVLYIIFFVSQASYFLSAFAGTLPSDFSYAEYARRGFFELFFIEIINMGIILFINLFCVKSGKNKSKILTFYTVMISFFTLLITATAVSKMVLYIGNYGLTQKRVYTSWFMLLTAVYFILIIIKQFRPGFNMMTSAAAVFCTMFGILCFSRPDAVIAAYNLEYFPDSISYYDLEQMRDMSDDAVSVILDQRFSDTVDSILSTDKERDEFLEDTEKRIRDNFYVRTNVSDIIINNKLR